MARLAGLSAARFAVLFPAALLIFPAQALASETSEIAEQFQELRERDTLLHNVGWRLLTGNVAQCPDAKPLPGLLLQDAGAYGEADAIRKLTGISGNFFVQSAASEGPAAAAGIAPDMEITAVDGRDLSSIPLSANEPWLRLEIVKQRIALSLEQNGKVELTIAGREDASVVAGELACASEFEMLTGNDKAVADGRRVAIGADFVGFAYPDDEFAAALAHELAHNLLGHAAWLDRQGRKRKHIRRTEREADRLMPWLLANAGYDPAAAVRFMKRWGPEHSGGWFRRRTHDGWDERVEFIEAELPLIARSQASTQSQAGRGAADWRRDFRREIDAK